MGTRCRVRLCRQQWMCAVCTQHPKNTTNLSLSLLIHIDAYRPATPPQVLLERSLLETEAELDNLARNRARLQRLLQRNARQLDLNENRQAVGGQMTRPRLPVAEYLCNQTVLRCSKQFEQTSKSSMRMHRAEFVGICRVGNAWCVDCRLPVLQSCLAAVDGIYPFRKRCPSVWQSTQRHPATTGPPFALLALFLWVSYY